jgi:hypothetical protein
MDNYFTRRDFIKISAAATAGAVTLGSGLMASLLMVTLIFPCL